MALGDTPIYTPNPPTIAPQGEDARNLAQWLQKELSNIANAISNVTRLQLTPINAPPPTPRDGLVVVADGTNWNPRGQLEHVYVWRNSANAWVQMDLGVNINTRDEGLILLDGFTAFRPQIIMGNHVNDASGTFLIGNKDRNATNTLSSDNFLTLQGSGFAGGAIRSAAQINLFQSGASVGNNIPSDIQFVWSDSSGLLNHNVFISAIAAIIAKSFVNLKIQNFIASGTYTPSAGLIIALGIAIGGGAAGGGVAGVASVSLGGGGGGSGSLALKLMTAASIGVSQTITIGAGGTGVSAAAGNSGGDTSIGALCIAKGGSGGDFNNDSTHFGSGGTGGIAGTGDITITGTSGSVGFIATASPQFVIGFSGKGGDSPLFAGGGPQLASGGAPTAGQAATGPGGGGGGAAGVNAGNAAGGAGFRGQAIIFEFCNQ